MTRTTPSASLIAVSLTLALCLAGPAAAQDNVARSHWRPPDLILALDLDGGTVWREVPAPFMRRALAAGTAGGRVYALGGLTPNSGPRLRVDALDTASGEWSRGPDLPHAGQLQGFGVAAASHSHGVLVSQADGRVYRLSADAHSWKLVAMLDIPRFMHELVPVGDRMLAAIGGASPSGHLATIELQAIERQESAP